MQRRLRWFAVRCQNARMVIKSAVALAKLDVPVFIAKSFRYEKRGKWMVAVEDGLLFPPYLFIAMRTPVKPWGHRANQLWSDVTEAKGVVRVMGCRDRDGDPWPCPIPFKVMRAIRTRHQSGERKKIEARFKRGQAVTVTQGPFTSFDGIFERPAGERVRIMLTIFGQQTEVQLEESDIRAA